jgi:hypothetical protein
MAFHPLYQLFSIIIQIFIWKMATLSRPYATISRGKIELIFISAAVPRPKENKLRKQVGIRMKKFSKIL